jgi:hypothetical protein
VISREFHTLLRDDPRARRVFKDPKLLDRLTVLVEDYAAGPTREWRRLARVVFPKVGEKGAALTRALGQVEHLMRDETIVLLLSWADGGTIAGTFRSPVWNHKMRAAGGYDRWMEALAELRALAQACADLKWYRGRGRVVDVWRRVFCRDVARALHAAGHKHMSGRDGVFAGVLTAALSVADQRAPEDVFPLVRKAIADLDDTEGASIRRAVEF